MRARGGRRESRVHASALLLAAFLALGLSPATADAAPPPTCGSAPEPGKPGCQAPGGPSQGPNGTLERRISVQVGTPSSAPYPDCGPSSGVPCVLTHSEARITSVFVTSADAEGNSGTIGHASFGEDSPCAGKMSCSGTARYLANVEYLRVDVSYQYGTYATTTIFQTGTLIGTDRYLVRLQGGGDQGEPRLEAVTIQEPSVRTGQLSTIGPNGTTDGNRLKVTARLRNPTTSAKAVKLTFRHPYSGTTAPGGERSLTLPAGACSSPASTTTPRAGRGPPRARRTRRSTSPPRSPWARPRRPRPSRCPCTRDR